MAHIEPDRPFLLSLFCGAGGMDSGFHQAGFQTGLAIDSCQDAVDTFNFNASSSVAVKRDLSKLSPKDFLGLIPKGMRPVGLIGGPPCQGFSRGNVSSDPNDSRNLLPFRYADLVKTAREKFDLEFFVFENVTGLLGSKHLPRFKRILDRLEKAGFNVFHTRLNAADYNVAQRRHRVFIVGLNKEVFPNQEFKFPKPSGEKLTVGSAIKGLPPATYFARDLSAANIPYHQNHWTMVPRSARFTGARQRSNAGRSFRILDWNSVSPTVAYGNREIHIHPDGKRRLTILEAMLLQGFDPGFKILGSFSSQVTQVSNAVPPPLARAIADQIKNLLDTSRACEAIYSYK
ncbi:DNA cytosine methyltransferase [Haloferula sp. BvORR071]|uniref:DNA cytosine methyltransferase n=1 Tax=Haloferula sp. BvORR071 TaxID=1396141 RepID=UPI002240EFD3|nr:DNA cytosine methyltransferase [Haloferula sp. BvORR071]